MDRIITAPCGRLAGVESEHCRVYKGVPYAQPPVGALRFRPPVKKEPWEGVFQADTFPSRCIQTGQKEGSFYYKEFFYDPAFVPPMSEDCLYLNIWVPKEAQVPCPVAVWYHGGGFMSGHSTEREFDGDALARRGIILVTVGYRLGIFGTFCHPELTAQDGHSGNLGLQDQIAALDWVRENISAFGGDPGCVTIFGQSAGAMAVRELSASPLARGKFHRAILQSGGGYQCPMRSELPLERMQTLWARYLKKKKLTLAQLMDMPPEAVHKLSGGFMLYAMLRARALLCMTPVIDGYVIPRDIDEMADSCQTAPVPCLTGATRDDMTVSKKGRDDMLQNRLLMSQARWSQKHTARGYDSFVYYFARRLPGDKEGAFHSAELWYMFGTLNRCWRPMEERDFALSGKMVDAWAAFMRTGNPGWEPYTGEKHQIQVFE